MRGRGQGTLELPLLVGGLDASHCDRPKVAAFFGGAILDEGGDVFNVDQEGLGGARFLQTAETFRYATCLCACLRSGWLDSRRT